MYFKKNRSSTSSNYPHRPITQIAADGEFTYSTPGLEEESVDSRTTSVALPSIAITHASPSLSQRSGEGSRSSVVDIIKGEDIKEGRDSISGRCKERKGDSSTRNLSRDDRINRKGGVEGCSEGDNIHHGEFEDDRRDGVRQDLTRRVHDDLPGRKMLEQHQTRRLDILDDVLGVTTTDVHHHLRTTSEKVNREPHSPSKKRRTTSLRMMFRNVKSSPIGQSLPTDTKSYELSKRMMSGGSVAGFSIPDSTKTMYFSGDNFGHRSTYRGIVIPRLTDYFSDDRLESAYQKYSHRQRQKSLLILNIMDICLKVSFFLSLMIRIKESSGRVRIPISELLFTLPWIAFNGVIIGVITCWKRCANHYLHYAAVLTWVLFLTEAHVVFASSSSSGSTSAAWYIIFITFGIYSMMPLPLTWCVGMGAFTCVSDVLITMSKMSGWSDSNGFLLRRVSWKSIGY